jgi:hypothetical protein
MMAEKGKIVFMQNYSSESEEQQAYRDVIDYLISIGRYDDAEAADNDASEKVKFCEVMDLYADDARLRNASVLQRKLQALIHSNQLLDIISENGGYLPGSNEVESVAPEFTEPVLAGPVLAEHVLSEPALDAVDDEVLPEIYTDHSDPAADNNDIFTTDANPDHDPGTTLIPVSGDHARSYHDLANPEPIIETAISVKENTVLHQARYLSTVLGIVAVLLAASRFYFDSDALLLITKYSVLLFSLLLLLSVALSEVSSRLMTRLRYAVSYSFLLVTATLSGLLFLQQPWADTAFHFRGGAIGMIVNFLIHRLIVIGPFWLGVFFAVTALFLLVVTWFAGRKISND